MLTLNSLFFSLVMQELLDTEKDYVNDIQCVIEVCSYLFAYFNLKSSWKV